MEHEFDEEAWIESLMTCEVAEHFAEEAIFQAIYKELAMRDKSWIFEGIDQQRERHGVRPRDRRR